MMIFLSLVLIVRWFSLIHIELFINHVLIVKEISNQELLGPIIHCSCVQT